MCLAEYIVRGVLGMFSVGAASSLRAAVSDRFGYDASVSYVLLTVAQFHLPFYWSRSLPNTIALVLTTVPLPLLPFSSPLPPSGLPVSVPSRE